MNSRWVTAVCMVLALATAPAIAPGNARAEDKTGPAVEVPEKIFDVGTVYPKDVYDHTFVIRNTGKADLVIVDVKPG